MAYRRFVNRRDFVSLVANRLAEYGLTVSYPDHPLLMRGPDVLSAAEDSVLAYFVYAGTGQRPATSAQQVRQLLSRLALPHATEFVLAVPNAEVTVSDLDVAMFDYVEVWTSGSRRREDRQPVGTDIQSVVDELRSFHMRRFSDAWAAPRDRPRRFDQARGIPTSELRRNRPRRRPRTDIDNGEIYAQLDDLSSRAALSSVMSDLIVDAVDLDYPMDAMGLSETARALYGGNAHLAMHHALLPPPRAGRAPDAYKPYRAAAFAGLRSEFEEV